MTDLAEWLVYGGVGLLLYSRNNSRFDTANPRFWGMVLAWPAWLFGTLFLSFVESVREDMSKRTNKTTTGR